MCAQGAIKRYIAANFAAGPNERGVKSALRFGLARGMFVKAKALFKLPAEAQSSAAARATATIHGIPAWWCAMRQAWAVVLSDEARTGAARFERFVFSRVDLLYHTSMGSWRDYPHDWHSSSSRCPDMWWALRRAKFLPLMEQSLLKPFNCRCGRRPTLQKVLLQVGLHAKRTPPSRSHCSLLAIDPDARLVPRSYWMNAESSWWQWHYWLCEPSPMQTCKPWGARFIRGVVGSFSVAENAAKRRPPLVCPGAPFLLDEYGRVQDGKSGYTYQCCAFKHRRERNGTNCSAPWHRAVVQTSRGDLVTSSDSCSGASGPGA